MPWWFLGISMVATTFSTDTPNLVTDIVRGTGVDGNWTWWAFLLTGMLTVFLYARLWRRSGVLTDVEFYEIRYSGPVAAFLRGFRAVYLGIVFNIIIMASVTLAAIKIGSVMMGWTPLETVVIAAVITMVYSALGRPAWSRTDRYDPVRHGHGRQYTGNHLRTEFARGWWLGLHADPRECPPRPAIPAVLL